jgi:hypothetical protein
VAIRLAAALKRKTAEQLRRVGRTLSFDRQLFVRQAEELEADAIAAIIFATAGFREHPARYVQEGDCFSILSSVCSLVQRATAEAEVLVEKIGPVPVGPGTLVELG